MADDGFQILFAGRRPGHMGKVSKRYDEFWAIHVVFRVDAHISYDVDHCHLTGDWIWFGHPGPHIRFASSGRMPRQHYRFALSGPLLASWRSAGLWPERPLPIHDARRMIAACEQVLAVRSGETAFDQRRQRHAVEGLLIEAHVQQRAVEPVANWVTAACRHIDEHCLETIDYGALANAWLMPLPRFRKAFRAAVGMPVHEYCLRARCRVAEGMLIDGDASLASIATACGYRDQGFFSRQFKRFMGVSPGQLRRSRYA